MSTVHSTFLPFIFSIGEAVRIDPRYSTRPGSVVDDSRPDKISTSCVRIDFWRLSPSSEVPPTSSLGRPPSPLLEPRAHPDAAHPSICLAYPKLEHMIEADEPSDSPGTWVHVVVAQNVVAVGVRLRDTPLLLVAAYDWRRGLCLGVSSCLLARVVPAADLKRWREKRSNHCRLRSGLQSVLSPMSIQDPLAFCLAGPGELVVAHLVETPVDKGGRSSDVETSRAEFDPSEVMGSNLCFEVFEIVIPDTPVDPSQSQGVSTAGIPCSQDHPLRFPAGLPIAHGSRGPSQPQPQT